ncbi:MAG: alkaline phosphatase D family protein [Flammeovirgaceae bacterium]
MKIPYHFLFLSILLLGACDSTTKQTSDKPDRITFKIMFGSCANQDKPQPLLTVAANEKPDAFVFLGDNVYGDTFVMDTLKAKYQRLGAKKEFQALRAVTPVFAVWDDHDFGWNDIGRHYPFKAESKEIFLDFWQVPESSDRRKHEGIYGVEYLEKDGKKLQLILLDTRTFRDDLVHRDSTDTTFKNDYIPNLSPDSTFLGEVQWAWLGEQLKQSADFRLIASSNQFSHAYNGWESWTNVPHERQRFIDLVKTTQADRVVFISGDVHWGEISKLEVPNGYPIYDITSSGITQTWHYIEPNKNRIGDASVKNNIGQLEVIWENGEAKAVFKVMSSATETISEHTVSLEEISF